MLFNPKTATRSRRGRDYIILRERDVHAVAASRLEESSTAPHS